MQQPKPSSEARESTNSNDDYITLAEAAKITPGRPSANAVWRWARRGILSRGGERIHLEHARVGGKIFTRPVWVREFGERVAASDTAHFQGRNEGQGNQRKSASPHRTPQRSALESELEEEGL